jgi:hypothetical protein
MRDQDSCGHRPQQVVVVAVAAAGLVADLEAIRQPFEESHHLVDGAYLGATDELPCLAEHAHGDPLAMDIEPNVQHKYLLKSGCVRNPTTAFHVTRLTEASFIVSYRSTFAQSDVMRPDKGAHVKQDGWQRDRDEVAEFHAGNRAPRKKG